jgi:plasmid stabilization system protein ParE
VKLEWSAAALADLDRFAAFLHQDHPELAAEIRAKAEVLSDHPLIGRPLAGRPKLRELPQNRSPCERSDMEAGG